MPNADFSQWTPLEFVARSVSVCVLHITVYMHVTISSSVLSHSKLYDWSENKDRPPNSSLVKLMTTDGDTKLDY